MNVIASNVVVFEVPVSIFTTRLAFSPSKVHVPEPVPEAHFTVTGLFMHIDDGFVSCPTHSAPVNGVVEGVRMMVSPTAALSYAVSRSCVSTVVVTEEEEESSTPAQLYE